jgi:tetratricopeptide (TPR) repeat protein
LELLTNKERSMPRKNGAPKSAAGSPRPFTTRQAPFRLYSPWLIVSALVVCVLVAYGPICASGSEFLRLDDGEYVVNNPHVQAGLTAESIGWAFTAFESGNWHPLVWLSLELDRDIQGPDAAGFHVTNVLLHAVNTVLLFLVLRRATAAPWRSALVAALFGLHPLHVESVAWIAERKDVLSTLFWLLTMYAYVWYTERPSTYRYAAVVIAFALGLMAKQMLVTLPVILLLFDYWPLQRFSPTNSGDHTRSPVSLQRLVMEKIPLLALAIGAGLMTLKAQRVSEEPLLTNPPMLQRLLNASLACVTYLEKTFWPMDLAPLYTRPIGQFPIWGSIASTVALATITAIVVWLARRRPPLAVGWFWFLIALLPVAGIIQVGIQTMADRYTYVPHIGLFLMLAWGLPDAWFDRISRPLLVGGVTVILLACLFLTRSQSALWRNNVDLWQHAVRATTDNFGAHDNLGVALIASNRIDEGTAEFRDAIRIEPRFALAHHHLGMVLELRRRWAEAAESFAEAARIAPSNTLSFVELGSCLMKQDDAAAAIEPLTVVAQRDPASPSAHYNLAMALLYADQVETAVAEATAAVQLNPDFVEARRLLGTALAVAGKPAEAEEQFRIALRLSPRPDVPTQFFLAWCSQAQGRVAEAQERYRTAVGQYPLWPPAARKEAWRMATHVSPSHRNGALALFRAEVVNQALEERNPEALDVLAAAQAELGRFEAAAATGRKAADLARSANQTMLAAAIDQRVRGYEQGKPHRE